MHDDRDLISVEAPMLLSAAVLVLFGCALALLAALASGA
jgi:hypothetical protein